MQSGQYPEVGAGDEVHLYGGQSQGQSQYGNLAAVTEAIPPVLMAGQQQVYITEAQVNPGSQDLFSQQTYISDPTHQVYEPDFQATEVQNGLQEAQPGYMTTGNVQVSIETVRPEPVPISGENHSIDLQSQGQNLHKVPVVEETIVPQIYTPLEENEIPQNPSNTMQDMQESGVSVEVNQETIKSGEEVTTVSVVASSLGKEKSMSPPVLEEEFEMNELGHDGEEAPVIEVEEEPKTSKSKAVIDVEIEEVAVSPSKKGRGKGKKQDEEKEPAEKKRRGRSAANAGIEKEETSSKRRTRGSKMDVTEEEEEKVEAEEVSDEEEDLVVNKATPKQYGKGRGRAKKEQDEDDIVISTPDTGKKGRGRSKKEQKEEGEEVKIETPKKGRGRRKKEEIIQEIDDDDENDEKVVETPKKGRGKSKKEEIKQDDDQEADIEEVTPVKGKRGKPSKSDTSGKVTRKALNDEEARQEKSPRGRRGRSKKAAEPEVEIETVEEEEEYEIMKNEDDEEEIKPDEADINKEDDEFIKEDEDDEEDTPLASLKRGRISDEMDPEPSTSGTVKKMKLESEEVYEHVIEDDGLDETKEELEEVMEDEFDETKEEEEEIEDEEEEEI